MIVTRISRPHPQRTNNHQPPSSELIIKLQSVETKTSRMAKRAWSEVSVGEWPQEKIEESADSQVEKGVISNNEGVCEVAATVSADNGRPTEPEAPTANPLVEVDVAAPNEVDEQPFWALLQRAWYRSW